jgi:hypothetical protein
VGRIETALIRHYLKPTVTSDLPGRLRLSFKGYQMLPKEALPYLHYVQDVMTMLPGVRGAEPRRSPAGLIPNSRGFPECSERCFRRLPEF